MAFVRLVPLFRFNLTNYALGLTRICASRQASDMSQTRRLAAILAADVTGYSRLIGVDESGPAAAQGDYG